MQTFFYGHHEESLVILLWDWLVDPVAWGQGILIFGLRVWRVDNVSEDSEVLVVEAVESICLKVI